MLALPYVPKSGRHAAAACLQVVRRVARPDSVPADTPLLICAHGNNTNRGVIPTISSPGDFVNQLLAAFESAGGCYISIVFLDVFPS